VQKLIQIQIQLEFRLVWKVGAQTSLKVVELLLRTNARDTDGWLCFLSLRAKKLLKGDPELGISQLWFQIALSI
jgi:hypothetical protein